MIDIPSLDEETMIAAQQRQSQLAKPPGSLGRLEELGIRLAGMRATFDAALARPRVIVCAGDHGVVAQGVSAYPQAVTAKMVETMITGKAAVNAVAAQVGADVLVVDAGVAKRYATPPAALNTLVAAPIRRGTADFTQGPAMRPGEGASAVQLGIRVAERSIQQAAVDLIAVGEMGIGNTTAASAIIAALAGHPPAEVTGFGAGVDEAGIGRKVQVIEAALALHAPADDNTLEKIGGYEIGAMAGVMLGAAAHRVPVIIDGLISTAAALIARQYNPAITGYLIAGHRSVEPGHAVALAALGLRPLLDLDMRLGEGTGAALAVPVVRAAAAALAEMATLAEVLP